MDVCKLGSIKELKKTNIDGLSFKAIGMCKF
jgi:hypothetical protein